MNETSSLRAPSRSLAGGLVASALDLLQSVFIRDAFLPPFSMRRLVGQAKWELKGEDFRRHGAHFVEKLAQDGGLKAESRILDLGSGCGRLAIPLTKTLGPSGQYFGLEPLEPMVRWCQRSITPSFPNFSFIHADVRNPFYNPSGNLEAETFQFPFAGGQFDLVVAVSVFTHLHPRAAENYAAESARVLKPGGRFFGTFYLLEGRHRSVDGALAFAHEIPPGAMTVDPALPERAIGHRTDWLLETFQQQGLGLVPPLRWGGWDGRQPAYSWWQDVLIFEKNLH